MKSIFTTLMISALTLLTGCIGSTNSVSFREMSSAYREVLEQYANDNLLLNVARSSKRMPLSFLDMPSVTGSGAINSTLGIGGTMASLAPASSVAGFFTPAAGGTSYTPNASLTVNNGFNFTQSSLDNASFMTAFLTSLTPAAISSLMDSEDTNRDVLFYLLIEAIHTKDANGKTLMRVVNDPASANYMAFQKILFNLMVAGVQVEPMMLEMPVSGPMDTNTINSNLQGIAAALALPGMAMKPAKLPNGAPGFQLVRTAPPAGKICLVKATAQEALPFNVSPNTYCKSSDIGQLSSTDTSSKPVVTLELEIRSVRNIFEFLGKLVTLQNSSTPKVILLPDSSKFNKFMTEEQVLATSKPLFVVNKGTPSEPTLMSINYQSEVYSVSVAASQATYTKNVMVLLSQMLTLNKVPGSIPVSPAVLIR